MTRSLGALVLIAACAAPTPVSVPPVAAPVRAPASPTVHVVEITGGGSYTTQLLYTQPGRAVVASMDLVALVDTTRFTQVGEARRLSSEVVEDRVDPIHHTIARGIRYAAWAWDRDGLVGVVDVDGLGGADPIGLAVWRPATEPRPAYLPDVRGFDCRAVAIAPDGARFATVGCEAAPPNNQTLELFALGDRVATVAPTADRAAFSADAAKLAFSTGDNTIGVYDIAARTTTMLPKVHAQHVLGLAFDPKRPVLVSADTDDVVVAWNLARGTRTRVGERGSLAGYSPDGRYLALARINEIVVLDASSLRRAFPLPKADLGWGPDGLAWSPDSRQLAVMGRNQRLTLVDFAPPPPSRADAVDDGWWARVHRLPAPATATPPPIGRDGVVEGSVAIAGKPVAGVEIRLVPHEQEWPDARALVGPSVRSGADGRFRIDHVPQILWNATAKGAGTTVAGFVADLRRQASVTVAMTVDPAVTIRGRVVGPDGRPAKGVRIVHYSYDGTIDTDLTTAADGSFAIDHLRPEPATSSPASTFAAVFLRGDGAVRTVRFSIAKAGPVAAGVVKLLGATDPHVVRVHVIDPRGAPVAGVELIVNEQNGAPTDAAGNASLDVPGVTHTSVRVFALAHAGTMAGGSSQIAVDLPQRAPLVVTVGN